MVEILLFLFCTHVTLACVTIYLHRSQAHRSVVLDHRVAVLMRTWLWLTTGMITKQWVAVHRKHHRFTDHTGDPHSPKVYGIWRVLFGGAVLYHRAASDQGMVEQYGTGTPDDWLENKLFTPYSNLGICMWLILLTALFNGWGIVMWLGHMLWVPLWAAGVVNGLAHYVGYRNFDVKDSSKNLLPWAIVICGEELHNNHHRFPASAKLSVRPWEFDLGWAYICTLERFNLATVKQS